MSFGGSHRLKHYTRLNVYKNSSGTVSYNPVTKEAYSYRWKFLCEVKGTMIFNEYKWSVTTSSHQNAVRRTLSALGISYICGDFGNATPDRINLRQYYKGLCRTELAIETTRKDTYKMGSLVADRLERLENIPKLVKLGFKLTEKDKQEVRQEVYDEMLKDAEEKEFYKACKDTDTKIASTDLTDPQF